MWSDNETSEDLLGFKIHADLLIDVINDDQVLPITIGVFGDWGSGKSSILKIINTQLSEGGEKANGETLVLYFNGWVFEGYDDAKAALLESIIEKFEEHKTIGHKVKDETTKLLRSVKWMRVMGLGFKKVVVPATAAYLTGGLSLIPSLLQSFSSMDKTELLNKLTGEDAESFLSDIVKKQPEDDVTLVREFREDFKEMIDKSGLKKLVVIIDDLDRCTPDRIIENLEAIKLFLNVDKTAFIIGADPRVVRHAIEHRYKTDGIENANDPNSRNQRIVSDYLEKLIQLPYNLPKLTDNEVETYMTLLFCKKELGDGFGKVLGAFCEYKQKNRYGVFGFGNMLTLLTDEERNKIGESVSLIASLASVITEGLNGNPRQIKRFLNTFTLRNRLVKVAQISDFKIDILAKLMVLEYSNPELFRKLYDWQVVQNGEPKELVDLEKLADKSQKDPIKAGYSDDWATEKMLQWLKVEPKLSKVDLSDYFWISRDQIARSISGSSLVPIHIRSLCQKLIQHGSGTILTNIITTEIPKLNETELETLFSLLGKEIKKSPESADLHKVYIELVAQKVATSVESYIRILSQVEQKNIPFSLQNQLTMAKNTNADVEIVIKAFKTGTPIYRALNPKK